MHADWISEQIQSYQAKKEDISDDFLVLQCDSEAEVKDLYKIDEECDIKSIYSSEAFENAYQSLSASISSESGDSSFGK